MTAKTPLVKAVATALITRPGWQAIQFHDTEVIGWDPEIIKLASGGWESVTTKRRMNQAAVCFDLGIRVYQTNHHWWVWFPAFPNDDPIPFYDGIILSRDRSQPHELETDPNPPQGYNGWPNRETWNVMLWLNNTEHYYRAYTAAARRQAFTPMSARDFAIRIFGYRSSFYAVTPDGCKLTRADWVRLAQAMNEGRES